MIEMSIQSKKITRVCLLLLTNLLLLSGCAARGVQEISSVQPETVQYAPAETITESVELTEAETESDTTEAPTSATEPAESTAITEPETEPEPVPEPFYYHGLVCLTDLDDRFVIDQRYATENNFTGKIHYDRVLCLVNQDIVPMLIRAADLAEEEGLRIKIWDAYRPISVQQALHDSAPAELAPYVPAPGPYSMHARGITVDVTLCDMEGNELDMPTGFDDFSTRANSDSTDATEEQLANRELLNRIMSEAGFKRSKLEWWHFDGPNRDKYEILDITFAEYEAARRDSNS